MKILNVFNHYLERGGEAHAVEAITDSLSQIVDLERCDFFSQDWVGPDAPAAWKQALWMIRNPASLNKIREQQQRFRSDAWLVHNVFPVGSAAIYSEAKKLRVPVIQYIHNFRPFSVNGYLWAGDRLAPQGLNKNYWPETSAGAWQNSRLKTAWLALILRTLHARNAFENVSAWIAISDFMREKFISAGVPPEKVFTLRHYWRPKPKSEVIDGEYYLFLGRLTHAKGVEVLIEVWKILERQSGASAPKLLIGGDGPLRAVVAAAAEGMRSVTYAGQLSEQAKSEALRKARAIIVPSVWWEPLGLVVYEAYDYSRPVLAASSGGLQEIVIEGQTGLLHAPGNARQLADQIIQVEAGKIKSPKMGEAGRLWLEQNANEAQWQEQFIEITKHTFA